MRRLVIAIDGPVAAGKGTLGRQIAKALDLAYLDTGSIYRAVAAKVLCRLLGHVAPVSHRFANGSDKKPAR